MKKKKPKKPKCSPSFLRYIDTALKQKNALLAKNQYLWRGIENWERTLC
jgi:hypothetical protein